MKKSSLRNTIDGFYKEMYVYGPLIAKMLSRGFGITGNAAEQLKIVEAIAVQMLTAWEVFVENLLIDCLNRDASQYARHRNLDLGKNLPRNVCEALLTGVGYLDIRSVGNLKGIAQRTIVDKYNPFKEIDAHDASRIDEFYKIRNYLAHRSRSSRNVLKNLYAANYGLQNFVEPGRFLMAVDIDNASAKLTRIQAYMDAFSGTAESMDGYLRSKGIA